MYWIKLSFKCISEWTYVPVPEIFFFQQRYSLCVFSWFIVRSMCKLENDLVPLAQVIRRCAVSLNFWFIIIFLHRFESNIESYTGRCLMM